MAQTKIGKLKARLEGAALELAKFDDFLSPVNDRLVALVWNSKQDSEIVKVAALDCTGHFYRGRIANRSTITKDSWDILADDCEMVFGVPAASFVALRLEAS